MRKSVTWVLGGVSLLSAAAGAPAAVLVADFNDITAGAINGKGGGTGWTGNWTGSAGGTVVANDLTSTLYNRPQAGTPQHFRNANNTGLRQNYRTPAASPVGTVWFSFLAMAEATGDRAGLSINAPTPTPFDDPGTFHAFLVGDTLNYQFGAGTAGTVPGAAAVGSTALVVGRATIVGGGGADSVTLWVNPNLIANPDINTIAPVYTNSSVNALDAITTVGAIAARADAASSGGGNVDNVRFSDGGGNPGIAYFDVTGVPEPGSAACLAALAGLGLLRRARRPARS